MDGENEKNGGAVRSRLEGLLRAGNLSGLEEAWLDEVAKSGEKGAVDPAPFLPVVDAIIRRGDRERARVLLDILLPAVGAEPRRRLEPLRRLILVAPSRKDLRTEFIDLYRQVHGGSLFHEACLAVAGVETAPDGARAIEILDGLLRYEPGTYVYHESGWGTGIVESIDPILRQAVVDLEGKRHHRIDLRAMPDVLEALPKDHFLALQRAGGAELRSLVEANPARLVEIVLSSFGNPLDLKLIKARLVPAVIPAEGWSKWWSRTKALLRESGLFRVNDKSPFSVERLAASMTYEDELLRQFEAGDFAARTGIIRKHGKDRDKYPRLWERLIADLRGALGRKGPEAIEAASLLERIAGDLPEAKGALTTALQEAPDPLGAILAMGSIEDRRRTIDAIPGALGPAWADVAIGLLQKGEDSLRDQAAKLLLGSPAQDRAVAAVAEAVRTPRASPDLYAWACRKSLDKEDSPFVEPFRPFPPHEILGRILDILDYLGLFAEREGKAAAKTSLNAARALLTADDCRFFRAVTKPMARPDARNVYGRVLSCGGLTEPLRVKLLEILMTLFPEVSRAEVRPIWEEDAIYVTERGLLRKRAEFRELTEEKLPKNFQDIGRAAAFGDLSENAEYTSALEERDRLTKRATELKDNLDKARILSPGMVKVDEIFLGSRVRLVNPASGHEVVYRILGPWDGDPEQGILSYRSPLAIGLFGKKVGDEVEVQLPSGVERFRVMEIGSAFEEGFRPAKA